MEVIAGKLIRVSIPPGIKSPKSIVEKCALRYNPIFDSKKNQTPLESLFYKGFTAVLLCFQV